MPVRKGRKKKQSHSLELAIIFVFILLSTLISLLLPFYFAYRPLSGT